MKILKIRTFNLNSLKGEKQIDFTEDRFVQTGFFAITGSTGAGKTTLLDAITLALYGEIPRQSDPKQIMSYGTAEAWAEVEFEVQDKKYRAKWSLARARRKPDGELQGVKRELADITESSEGQILGEKIKEVQEKIVEITGLDFQRFLRSVMLAQGEFAAFLKADKKERGVLLERVTDTSIYTELSRKAHEIEKEKRHALDLERKNIKEEDLLTPEGRNSLENQLEQEKIRLEQIKKELEKISFQKNWLEKVQNLARQCEQAQNTWEQAQTAFEKFAPERKRLERHEQLTILKPDYLLLTNFEKALSEQTQKINLLEAELPTLKNRLDQSKKRMEDSEKELEKVQTEKAEQEPVFAKVLALDSRLKDLYENLQKLNLEYKEQEKILTENLQKLQEKEGLEKAEEESIQKIQDWLVKKANFEQIGAELGTLQIWDEERKDFAKNVSNKTLKISELEKDKTNLDKQIEGQKTDLEKMEAWKKAQQEKIRVLETEIAEKLEGKTVQAWQEKNEFSAQTISHLEKMQGLAERFLKNKNKLQILENQIVEKTKSKENSLLDLAKTEKELAEAQEQSKLLEKLWEAEKQIAKYEADRKTLEKDQACPLCGSVHHPFVGAYKVDLSLAERQFQEQKSKVKTLETAFQKSKTQIQITENE